MAELSDVNTGDIITAQRQNDINDYIHDGTHEINTKFIRLGSNIFVDVGSSIVNGNNAEFTGSVESDIGSFTDVECVGSVSSPIIRAINTDGMKFFSSSGSHIATLDDNGNFLVLGRVLSL
jgi:hypothetical protein